MHTLTQDTFHHSKLFTLPRQLQVYLNKYESICSFVILRTELSKNRLFDYRSKSRSFSRENKLFYIKAGCNIILLLVMTSDCNHMFVAVLVSLTLNLSRVYNRLPLHNRKPLNLISMFNRRVSAIYKHS